MKHILTLSALVGLLLGAPAHAQQVTTTDFDYYSQDQQSSDSPSDLVEDSGYIKGGCEGKGSCGGCDSCDAWTLFPEWCGVKIGGWIQAGYHSDTTGLFNTHPDRLNIHQMWLYAERKADNCDCGWDWGFRADAVYGVDAQNTQAFGNNAGRWDFQNGLDHGIYGWAVPQAYLEFASGDLSIKAGHFFTIIGYETVAATGNFFYSHAFTMNNSEPFTHTGVLASYEMYSNMTVHAGWTLGWDTGFDQFGTGNAYLGGVTMPLTETINLSYMSSFGDFGRLANGQDGTMNSFIFDTQLTDRTTAVLQSDILRIDGGRDDVGINGYLIHEINSCWAIGGRMEWWRSDGVSNYAATAGVNWTPIANLRIRPEVRQQWVPATGFDETIFGIDAILTF